MLAALLSTFGVSQAYLTFQTIKDLTSITDECTARVYAAGDEGRRLGKLPGSELGQVLLASNEDVETERVCTQASVHHT